MGARTITKTRTRTTNARETKAKVNSQEYSMDLSDSSDEERGDDDEPQDDFEKEMMASIAAEALAKVSGNGKGKKKKANQTLEDLTTANTRKKHRKGQRREQKTAKWAMRERRSNPLVKLLDIQFELQGSESDSSSGFETDEAREMSDASRRMFDRSRRRRQNKKARVSNLPKKTQSAKDAILIADDSGKENRQATSSKVTIEQAGNASETDSSDDVSPMLDPAGYQNQIERRKKRRRAKLGIISPTQTANGSDINGSIRKTPIHPNADDSDTEESDDNPDYPPNDPRYPQWIAQKNAPFTSYTQNDSRPNFEVKTAKQRAIGPFKLGVDSDGKQVRIPASINRFLRAYQQEGVQFFWQHYAQGEGGLLGDDMGLGKTIQVIAFLTAIIGHQCTPKEQNRREELVDNADSTQLVQATDFGPTALVIAPVSVVDNWAREIETWTYLSFGIYRGSKDHRRRVIKNFRRGRLDIILAGYDAVRTHIDELQDLDLSCVFADEVHRLKNPKSKTSVAFQQFACKVRFGLTGTAMQNRYAEMHTTLDWCFPGRLGTRAQWADYVASPLKDAQKKDATSVEIALGRLRAISFVTNLLPHFFIRRTKELIADQLPKKTDKIVFCPLTPDQQAAYLRLLCHQEVEIILTHDLPCPCGSTDQHGRPYRRDKCCEREWNQLIFKWIHIFIKLANHAVLLYPHKSDLRDNPEKFAHDQEITRLAFPDDHHTKVRVSSESVDMDYSLCGKWPVLRDLLESWKAKGDKVLLFSRSTRLLDALQYWLDMVPYDFLRLDGQVPVEKRLPLCDDFNDPNGDKFLFLISTLAGGVGLNLTAANRVVIFDPNWNPVQDLQAMDRSYRWCASAYLLCVQLSEIGAGTIEELIYTRQIYKQHQAEIAYNAANPSRMFAGVEGRKGQEGELFGVKNLFRFALSGSRTKLAIEDAHVNELSYAILNHKTAGKGTKRKNSSDNSDSSHSENEQDKSVDDQAALDALLANPDAAEEDDEIERILTSNGVAYSHMHTDLVKTSTIEANISNAAMRDLRDRKGKGRAVDKRISNENETMKAMDPAQWAPSKGKKPSVEAAADQKSLEMMLEEIASGKANMATLAQSLGYNGAGHLGRAFSEMDAKSKESLLDRAFQMMEDAKK